MTANAESTAPGDVPPIAPDKPLPSDCCGGGCARCVFDVYEDALERYMRLLALWRAR